jgi:hypothetical protein
VLRASIIIIVLCSLVLQSIQTLSYTALYQLNKKFIAEKLCENKSRPQMHCNGKCYLKKQLAKSTEEQNSNKPSATLKFENIECEVEPFFSITPVNYRYISNALRATVSPIQKGFSGNVFRPPLG